MQLDFLWTGQWLSCGYHVVIIDVSVMTANSLKPFLSLSDKAHLPAVNRMRKNKNVGAASGRIHPIGSGPMIWYQKFEYATGYWLQKVISCAVF